MKQLLGFLGFIALAHGVGGLVHQFTDRFPWGLVHRWSVLDGHEVAASVGLIVVAGVMFVASDHVGPG